MKRVKETLKGSVIIFKASDCMFLVVCVYFSARKGSREEYIIYYWLGHESSADEQGVAAYETIRLDDSLGQF